MNRKWSEAKQSLGLKFCSITDYQYRRLLSPPANGSSYALNTIYIIVRSVGRSFVRSFIPIVIVGEAVVIAQQQALPQGKQGRFQAQFESYPSRKSTKGRERISMQPPRNTSMPKRVFKKRVW
jgi:hypothetical protein